MEKITKRRSTADDGLVGADLILISASQGARLGFSTSNIKEAIDLV